MINYSARVDVPAIKYMTHSSQSYMAAFIVSPAKP